MAPSRKSGSSTQPKPVDAELDMDLAADYIAEEEEENDDEYEIVTEMRTIGPVTTRWKSRKRSI